MSFKIIEPLENVEEFEVDVELERYAILDNFMIQKSPYESFDSLRIGSYNGSQEFSYITDRLRAQTYFDMYSKQDDDDLLVVNSRLISDLDEGICLASQATKTIKQLFYKNDISDIIVLQNTVTIAKKQVNRKSKHLDLMIIDKRRYAGLTDYLGLFWCDFL